MAGRVAETTADWDYLRLARSLVRSGPVLDLGTGGGEVFAAMAPLPAGSAATEGWPANVPVATARLDPLGIRVDDVSAEPMVLPYPATHFDLILNRHEAYDATEIARVLTAGGTFLTQQVASSDGARLNEALGGPPPDIPVGIALAPLRNELERAGMEVLEAREEVLERTFTDIGALIWYLRIIAWQVPDFDVERYEEPLRALHAQMAAGQPFVDVAPRLLLHAVKPR